MPKNERDVLLAIIQKQRLALQTAQQGLSTARQALPAVCHAQSNLKTVENEVAIALHLEVPHV